MEMTTKTFLFLIFLSLALGFGGWALIFGLATLNDATGAGKNIAPIIVGIVAMIAAWIGFGSLFEKAGI